jgi:putative transposase
MKKTFKFRIYPNRKQEAKLNRTLNTCRRLYNESLAARKRQAELNELKRQFEVFPWGYPEYINYYDQANDLSQSKTSDQKEVFSQVLQDVLRRLEKAFKSFYRGFGYPRFQGMGRYNSFSYPQSGFKIDGDKLNLSKIGLIKIILHRAIEGTIKTCTIMKDIDQWYVCFSCELETPIPKVELKTQIGIDVGLKSLITLSTGEQINPPEFLRRSEQKLTREQKRLSRKKKRSQNRQKQQVKVAKVHRKIRNQRKDFAHKLSRSLVNGYGLIVFENLNIKGMVQNHHIAKSISDAGWAQLISLTTFKAAYAGTIVEQVNARNTSQACSHCGTIVPKNLSVRIHICPFCGLVLDRDHNAARNILKRSKNTVGITEINARQGTLNRDSMQREAPTFKWG